MTVDSAPLVSVIIIFFNRQAFIQEAIQSVFTQTYDHWELLLVDDGSTDGSSAIARQYAQQHPEKVRYFEHDHHQNRGISATRNLGLQHVLGDWISFLDADDIWLPQKLEQQLAVAAQNPTAGMICGPTEYWYSWTDNPHHRQKDQLRELLVDAPRLYEAPLLLTKLVQQKAQTPATCSVLIRRSALKQVGGFVEDFCGMYDDQVFFSKIYLHIPVFVDRHCWDRYRQHPESICAQEIKAGRYHPFKPNPARKTFLVWLETYLLQQNVQDPKVFQALNRALWPYRHPRLGKAIFEVLHWLDRINDRMVQPLLRPFRGRSHPSEVA